MQVQVLFSELAMVEEEISRLERKVEELKLRLYQEREQTKEWEVQRRQGQQNHLLCRVGNQSVLNEERCSRSQNYEALRKERRMKNRRASVDSASDFQRWNFPKSDGKLLLYLI